MGFAGTSSKYINAEIQRNWSRSHEVGLVDLDVTGSNQDLVVRLVSAAVTVAYVFTLVDAKAVAASFLPMALPVYCALQLACLISEYQIYQNMPEEAPYERSKKDCSEPVELHALPPTLDTGKEQSAKGQPVVNLHPSIALVAPDAPPAITMCMQEEEEGLGGAEGRSHPGEAITKECIIDLHLEVLEDRSLEVLHEMIDDVWNMDDSTKHEGAALLCHNSKGGNVS